MPESNSQPNPRCGNRPTNDELQDAIFLFAKGLKEIKAVHRRMDCLEGELHRMKRESVTTETWLRFDHDLRALRDEVQRTQGGIH